MIENENFRLRLIEETDLSFVKNLRQHSETAPFLGSFALLNDARQKLWFESSQKNSSSCYMIFEKVEKDKISQLGMVRITDIDFIHRSMCVGGDIVPCFRGKGYAKQMYALIFKYGFETMNMHRLWLCVLENNERAKKLYEKMGFSYEGMQREAVFKDGVYHNYLMMSILNKEYLEGKK